MDPLFEEGYLFLVERLYWDAWIATDAADNTYSSIWMPADSDTGDGTVWLTGLDAKDMDGTRVFKHQVAEHISNWDPARVAADVESKQDLLNWIRRWYLYMENGAFVRSHLREALRLMMEPYADHPDFPEGWKK